MDIIEIFFSEVVTGQNSQIFPSFHENGNRPTVNDRNDTLSSRVLCLVVSISDMHTKKEEERKEKGKIRGNGDTLENHKGNVRKTRERERER